MVNSLVANLNSRSKYFLTYRWIQNSSYVKSKIYNISVLQLTLLFCLNILSSQTLSYVCGNTNSNTSSTISSTRTVPAPPQSCLSPASIKYIKLIHTTFSKAMVRVISQKPTMVIRIRVTLLVLMDIIVLRKLLIGQMHRWLETIKCFCLLEIQRPCCLKEFNSF